MNKKMTTLLLLAASPMYAVKCGGPTEAEPNGTFQEAWDNPDHPVLYPDVFLVSGFLDGDDTRDDWWIMASDTPIMRMREADVAKLQSPFSIDKRPHRFSDFGVSKLRFGNNKLSDLLAQAKTKMRFNIESFPTLDGPTVTLEVEPIDVLDRNTKIVAASIEDGVYKERPLKHPELTTLSGIIANEPDSLVFLALDPKGDINGFIRRDDRLVFISMESDDNGSTPVMFDPHQVPEELLPSSSEMCQQIALLEFQPPVAEGNESFFRSSAPLRRLEIAIDTDREFTQDLFGGNSSAAVAYTVVLMSAASAIYTDQLNIELDLTYLRLWPDSEDPFNSQDTVTQLFEFRSHWENSMSSVDRDLAHLLSGKLGGGAAFLGGLCSTNGAGYGASRVDGYFPTPVEDFSPFNWDIFVFTHELGHNLGAPHTHDYCPPLDRCAPDGFFGDCQDWQACSNNGTIMSYCHVCSGGMRNIRLQFHDEVKATILNYLDAISCDYTTNEPATLLGGVALSPGSDISATLQRIVWADEESWYYEVVDRFEFAVPAGGVTEIFNVSFEFDARDPHVYTFEGTAETYLFSLYIGQ